MKIIDDIKEKFSVDNIRNILFKEPEQRTIVIHRDNVGSSGIEIFSGYYAEEYLTSLRDSDRADEFDKMRRGDPQVKMLLSSVKNPIKRALWTIEPHDQDDPNAVADAKLIEKILFEDMKTSWSKFINENLTQLEFGHAVFEKTHKIVEKDSEFGTYISLKDLAWRSPKTIQTWNLDENGKLISITQFAFGDLDRQVDIDAQFLSIFTLDMEGDDYQGIPMLRPLYGNFFRKNIYLKLNAIGIEKFAIPTPIAKVPNGRQGSTQKSELETALEKYTTHQSNYLIIPEGFEIDLNTNSYDPAKVEVSIDNEDKRMAKAFLANFLELGQSGGSYALSTDLSDFFLSALDHIAQSIADNINKNIIPEMIDLNRPNRSKYPKLKVSGISDKAGKELAEILSSLSSSQVIQPDDKLEEHIRKRYKLPEKSEEGIRQPKQDSIGLAERVKKVREFRLFGKK